MKPDFVKLGLLMLALGASPAHSQNLNWSSLTGSSFIDSEGEALDTTFLFQLGTFDPDFVPTEQNVGNWLQNWRIFDTAAYSNTGDGQYFTGTEQIQDHGGGEGAPYNDYPLFEGLKAYVLIRNQDGTEFFLASASNWVFPDMQEGCCPNGLVTNWSISDLGTDTPIWGSQNGIHGGGDFFDTGIFHDIQTHAIPEPGALFLAFASAGLVLVRRRRPWLQANGA